MLISLNIRVTTLYLLEILVFYTDLSFIALSGFAELSDIHGKRLFGTSSKVV